MPDMRTLSIKREHRFRRILIVAVIFFVCLAAAAWAGFLVFKPFGAFQGGGVAFEFQAPDEIVAGAESTIIVKYINKERVPLGKLGITITIPHGFALTGAEPAATDGRRWLVGNVASKSSGEIKLTGRVLAVPGSELAFQTFATYVPGNFNSEFESVGSYRAQVTRSSLEITSDAPESAVQGDPLVWNLTYKNNGNGVVDGAELHAVFPTSFQFVDSRPTSSVPGVWPLGSLPAGTASSVVVRGAFSAEASGATALVAMLGRRDGDSFGAFATATSTVNVIGGELKTTLLVNGSANAQAVNFGDTLRMSIVYTNEGTEVLKDVEIALSVAAMPKQGDTTVIDWGTLESSNGSRDGNRIRWTRRTVGALKSLAPGAEGSFDLSLALRDRPFTLDDRGYRVQLMVETRVGVIGSRRVDRAVSSNPLILPVNSDAALSSGVRYYNDDEVPVGTGPLPPKVGETTTYHVFWKVTNTLHELQGLAVAATLPDGVNWTNKSNVSAGTVEYRPGERKVVWTLNRMPDTVPEITADFEISVIPSAAQAGKIIPLLGDATLDADDSVAQSHLTRSAPAADSSLEGDPIAEGRGTVVR